MDQQQNKGQNSGGNGFILGVIVGVLIALLFTTKKGRAILRDVTDKGIDKLSTLEELRKRAGNSDQDEEISEEDDYVEPEPVPVVVVKEEVVEEIEEAAPIVEPKVEKKEAPAKPVAPKEPVVPEPEEEVVVTEEPQEKAQAKVIQGRRWFRGLKKKSN